MDSGCSTSFNDKMEVTNEFWLITYRFCMVSYRITKIALKNFWTFFDKEDRLEKLQKSDFQNHFSTS